jgi:hypothetical protein
LRLENWANVKEYPGYKVSDMGRVMSHRKGEWKILKSFLNKKGYPRINLMKNGKIKQVFIHRLVAAEFLGDYENKQVNHKSGIKTDNSIENLELVTCSENIIHSFYCLKHKKLKPVKMIDLQTGEVLKTFPSIMQASRELNVNNTCIYRVCTGERNKAAGYKWEFEEVY